MLLRFFLRAQEPAAVKQGFLNISISLGCAHMICSHCFLFYDEYAVAASSVVLMVFFM